MPTPPSAVECQTDRQSHAQMDKINTKCLLLFHGRGIISLQRIKFSFEIKNYKTQAYKILLALNKATSKSADKTHDLWHSNLTRFHTMTTLNSQIPNKTCSKWKNFHFTDHLIKRCTQFSSLMHLISIPVNKPCFYQYGDNIH